MFVLGLPGLVAFWGYYSPLWAFGEPFFRYSHDIGLYEPTWVGAALAAFIYSTTFWAGILVWRVGKLMIDRLLRPAAGESGKSVSTVLHNLFRPHADSAIVFPEPATWSFPEVIELARRLSPNNIEGKPFNAQGLVYSEAVLATLRPSMLSARVLQKYADIVTHAYPDAVAKQLPLSCTGNALAGLNITAVAGIAFISLHAKDGRTRMRARQCLRQAQYVLRTIDNAKSNGIHR